MAKPANLDELCDRLNAYFVQLTAWGERVNNRLSDIEDKMGGEQTDDPPPPPPELT